MRSDLLPFHFVLSFSFFFFFCPRIQVAVDEGRALLERERKYKRKLLDNATRRIFTSSAVIPAGTTQWLLTFYRILFSLICLFTFRTNTKKKLFKDLRARPFYVSPFYSECPDNYLFGRLKQLIFASLKRIEDATRSDFIASTVQSPLPAPPACGFQLDVSLFVCYINLHTADKCDKKSPKSPFSISLWNGIGQ